MHAIRVGCVVVALTVICGSDLFLHSSLEYPVGRAPAQAQSPEGFIPGVPTVLPAPLKLVKVIPIPGLPVASVDILWADQASERLYLSDRTNASIDIFDGENDLFVGRVTGLPVRRRMAAAGDHIEVIYTQSARL